MIYGYGLRLHDTHTKFHKEWSRHSEVIRGKYTERMGIA
jgi:hypothetical protein